MRTGNAHAATHHVSPSGHDDSTGQPTIVANAKGTFVAAWNAGRNLVATTRLERDRASGAPVTVGSNLGSISLAIASGGPS
ncbi:MAG TPA: hypothetical protein VF516_16550 [Kofleriaceae bacterium]